MEEGIRHTRPAVLANERGFLALPSCRAQNIGTQGTRSLSIHGDPLKVRIRCERDRLSMACQTIILRFVRSLCFVCGTLDDRDDDLLGMREDL